MKEKINLFFSKFRSFFLNNKVVTLSTIFLFSVCLVVGMYFIPKTFAQPVKNIEVTSTNSNYEEKTPGAWKVNKSAKWIDKGVAEITFDVESILKSRSKYTDVIFVLDISGSMSGKKLERVKTDSIELIESLLSNNKNKVGLITFDSTSEIVSDFTSDKEDLIEKINSLSTKGTTNYYQALINVDNILKNYVKEKARECIVLFLTDGNPCEETQNEVGEYSYLKNQYSYMLLNAIQYEMGSAPTEAIKNISDNQYIADMETLNNVLFEASVTSIPYEKFEITDYIDNDYYGYKATITPSY